MNYRQKERAIDKALWEHPIVNWSPFTKPSGNPIETLPSTIVEIYRSLQYTDKQILQRWREIQEIKKENNKIYGMNYRLCSRRRWYQYKTRHRYYADFNKKVKRDRPIHQWNYGYSYWSIEAIKERAEKERLKEEAKRKFVKHSSEIRTSKIHSIKNKKS